MIKFFRESIATKFSFLIILMVMLTATIVGMIFFYGSNEILIEKEFKQIDKSVAAISGRFTETITTLRNDLLIATKLPAITKIDSHDDNTKAWVENLFEFKKTYLSMTWLPEGKTIAQTYNGQNKNWIKVSNESFFSDVGIEYQGRVGFLSAGEVFYSNIHLQRRNGKIVRPIVPVIHVASPVYIGARKAGTLFLTKNVSGILNYMKTGMHKPYQFYAFSSNGDYIVHPATVKTFGRDLGMAYQVQDEFPIFEERKFLTTSANNFHHIDIFDGVKKLIYSKKVYFDPSNPAKGYVGMILSLPRAIVLGSSISIRRKSFVLTLALIAITAVLGWIFSKFLTKHLNEITELAKRYTRGETDVDINIQSKDEIGILALTFQGMIRQVNERVRIQKKNERELREARDQSEEALKAKSQLLDDLRKQKSEIEKVSKDKDELLAIVSHDLKNPLAVIETTMDILGESVPKDSDGTVNDLIRRAKNSARFALNLITDLLDLARLEGGIKLDFEKFFIKDLIDSAVDSFFLKAQEKNVTIKTHYDENFEIFADYGRIIQVINNLVGNALKFIPNGGQVNITVTTFDGRRQLDGQGKILKIIVADNGPGIPKEKLDSIFDKFEQARATDREIGTGLGLAISRNILTLHNGNIWVESEEGRGARFIITLPRVVDSGAGTVVESESNIKKYRILLVDDSIDYRVFMKKKLKDDGHIVEEVENGELALNALNESPFDLVLMDIDMPVMEGIEALKEIRENEKLKSIPIIVVSKNLDANNIKFINKLANDYVHKTADFSELQVKIEEVLNPGSVSSFKRELDFDKKTLLIADEEESIRELLSEKLKSLGYNVIKAKNGGEAIFLFKKYKIDMVITDIRLPEIDGLTIAKVISEEFEETPIVLMSANIVEIPEGLLEKVGVCKLISKPFELKELVEAVKDNIGGGSNLSDETVRNITAAKVISKKKEYAPVDAKVLVVDDSEDMQLLIKVMFKNEAIELDFAENGKVGVEKFKKGGYDIVLMDLNMPVMGGMEAIVLMRAFEKKNGWERTPIMAISANNSKQDLEAYLNAGFDGQIGKPFKKDHVLELVLKKAA